ncbi:MAG: 2OG-Fe(II) oxygenase [Proteobacteria bacterium]|nr:2OG-Fe(II) oxygenase [Pseudomonadota bacterium]
MSEALQQQAAAGDARAQGELGGMMLVGRGVPYAPKQGLRLIEAAAERNDTTALQLLAVLTALGVGRPHSWNDAVRLVARAAELGDERAQGQLAILGDPATFDIVQWFGAASAEQRCNAPRVVTVTNFLPKAACNWIVERTRPRLEIARVNNPVQGGTSVESNRTNTGAGFSVLDSDLILELANARVAAMIRLPRQQQEPTNVLHYDPGQEFQPHFDYIDPAEPLFVEQVRQQGQRLVTALIYLNDDFEGGETDFPRLNWRFKGAAGDALMFWNVAANGALEPASLHAGLPPTRGEKWIYSKWVRDRALPLI